MLKKIRLSRAGFTLIEVLVVVAIIAILVAIIFAAGNSAKKTARDNQRATDIKLLQVKIGAYMEANESYPATLTQLGLAQMPLDPLTGAEYSYAGLAFSGSTYCATYHLGATLETTAAILSQKASQAALGANRQTPYVLCSNNSVTSGVDFDGTAALVYDVVSPESFQK